MQAFDTSGAKLVRASGISAVLLDSKALVVQDDTGASWALGLRTVDGETDHYWISVSTAKMIDGQLAIRNDTDSHYYWLRVKLVDSEATLYWVDTGQT